MEGLGRHSDRVKFVLVHHEEAAAFMATAYAKATGKLGVCLATSGPGAIHLLNGLYDAKLDHMPVLAITGMQETSVLGTGYQQEVHTDRLYADLAEYNLVVENPAQLPGVVDIAIRTALARRGVAHLTFPNVQFAGADEDPYQSDRRRPGAGRCPDADRGPGDRGRPESLQALIPLLTRKSDRGHLEKYQKEMARWRSDMADLESPKRTPIAPQYPVGVLDDLAAGDAVLTCDSGTIATWAARHWTIRGDRQFYLSGNLATMAPVLPYALGIQHAFPGRQVIAYDQAKKFAQAFLKGQPHKAAIATTLFKDKIEQLGRRGPWL